MGDVTAVKMDVITEKSGHNMVGMAVSVCTTPAAPSPLPIPYPTTGSVAEGSIDSAMRTKICGAKVITVGSCMKACHGNEPGTLKEVVSLNTGGPCFPALGAPIVLIELGMAGITGSIGQMNKAITVGAGGSASGAGGGAGGGGGGGGGAGGPGGGGPKGPAGGGGGGGGGNQGAAPPSPPAPPTADGQAAAGHPVDVITGSMFTPPAIDFTLTGFLWVRWIRSYSSSAVQHRCGIGWGWSHNLAWSGERHGATFTLVDDQQRRTQLPLPDGDDEIVLLPYGRKVSREGEALVIDLNDGLVRVLRSTDGHTYRLVQLRDHSSSSADITWDGDEVVAIVDSVGRRAALTRDGNLRSWSVTVADAAGVEHRRHLVGYELDARGDLVSVIDSGGAETRYAYDADHYLVAETRADGLVYHFRYDDVAGQRRCVETWGELPGEDILAKIGDPDAAAQSAGPSATRPRGVHHVRIEYGPGPFDTRVVDALGNVHRYQGNQLGLVERYVDPRGYVTSVRYDATGNVVSITDGGGTTLSRSYDADGKLSRVAGPGAAVTYRYEGDDLVGVTAAGARWAARYQRGKVVEETDARGGKITHEYDERGLRTSHTTADGVVQRMEYDAHGNIERLTDSAGATYLYAFDLFGRPVRVETPAGATYEMEYDSRGDLVVTTATGGVRTEHLNDDMRRIVATRHAGGGVTESRYVGDALVERIYPDGARWRMGYDALLRLRWIDNPAGERYWMQYDGASNLIASTTFAGLTYAAEYDGANRRVSFTRPDGTRVEIQRNRAGLPVALRYNNGLEERFQYDDAGNVVHASNGTASVELAWGEDGALLREIQSCGGWRFGIEYEHDAHGRLVGQRYSTGWGVTMGRDASGMLESIRVDSADPSQGREAVLLSHDVNACEIERRRESGPGKVVTERNAHGFPTRISVLGEGDEPLRERSYTWDERGPLREITDSERGSRRYQLDAVGRPVSVDGLGAQERFGYAAQGTALPAGGGWSVGPGGRPTRVGEITLRWDAHGRLASREGAKPSDSWQYHYDATNRLILAERGDGHRVQYLYDPFGRRLAEIQNGESTWFGWNGDSIVEERGPGAETVRRVFGEDEFTPLLEAPDGRSYRLAVCDAASTPWLWVDAKGATAELDLSAWGEVAHERGDAGRLRFAGQRADAVTGLHYHRHRFYAPDLHVFITPDPLGLLGSLQDIGFLPNVTFYLDPLGLWVAIIQGADESPRKRRGNAAVDMAVGQYAASNPGGRVIRHDQLGPGSLQGATQVIVISHGAPGSIDWGPHRPIIGAGSINGEQLGDKLNAAGFDGTRPGARVDVLSCNAATPPLFGGNSVSQGVANRTMADTTGARANNRLLGALSQTGTTATGGAGTYQGGPHAGKSFHTPGPGGSGPAHETVTGGSMVTVSPRPATR